MVRNTFDNITITKYRVISNFFVSKKKYFVSNHATLMILIEIIMLSLCNRPLVAGYRCVLYFIAVNHRFIFLQRQQNGC